MSWSPPSGPCADSPTYSKPAFPACSRSATSAAAARSGSPPPWARARSRSPRCTRYWPSKVPKSRRGGSGRQKILLIEDDPVARADLQARLEANGYVVARAADAASALTVVNREHPDLILLDLGLPAGDGYLVLERLRKIESLAAIPVLVLTGRSDAETRKRVQALGVPPVLVKPVQTEALLAAISEALETRSA